MLADIAVRRTEMLQELRLLLRQSSAPRAGDAPIVPSSATASFGASSTTLSAGLDRTLTLLAQWFPTIRPQQLQPLLHLLQEYPELSESLLAFTERLAKLPAAARVGTTTVTDGSDDDLVTQGLQLATAMARNIQRQSPAVTPLARHVAQPQQLHQQLDHVAGLLAERASASDDAPHTLLPLLQASLQESPETFEAELIALPVALRAGLTSTTYQAVVDAVDPLRLASLVATARSHGQERALAQTLTQQIQAGESPLPSVEQWEQQLRPAPLPRSTEVSLSQADGHSIDEGIVTAGEGAPETVPLVAFSPRHGVLPDEAWRTRPPAEAGSTGTIPPLTAQEIGIRGAILFTASYPPGLHRLRLTAVDPEGDEAWAELLLHIVRGGERESNEDASETEHQEDGPTAAAPYHGAALPPAELRPLVGSIGVAIEAPVIVRAPHRSRSIAAPLQVTFHFLADLVDPRQRGSRRHFLTLAASPEAAAFHAAVRALNQGATDAFAQYTTALRALFARLETDVPAGRPVFVQARQYLHDVVRDHLTGVATTSPTTQQRPLAALSPQGDLIASVLCTSAGALAHAGQFRDALIHCAAATDYAAHKPYFLDRLERFLGALRDRLAPGHHRPPAWTDPLPVLPPPTTAFIDTTPTPTANLFTAHILPQSPQPR